VGLVPLSRDQGPVRRDQAGDAGDPFRDPPLVYDFAEELLAGQRKFAEEVLHLAGRHAPALAK
jgi:hypothetical protein